MSEFDPGPRPAVADHLAQVPSYIARDSRNEWVRGVEVLCTFSP
jgi:hypothetical protein